MDGWHFHKENDAQLSRDKLKNQIFTKLGLPLIRISTTDTVNQETIKKIIISNFMKLGYIHSNREEQTRVMQVLKMTSESVALDELGIGRIRDAFADRMFPGISTLQKHMKYFSLMPQLYRKATEKRYNRLSEVKAEIIRLERIMTKIYTMAVRTNEVSQEVR